MLGAGIGQGDLADDPLAGQRGAQLVRGVGDELALGAEGCLQPGQQRVEGVAEFLELVIGAGEGEALAQAGGGDLAGGRGDGAQRPQHAAGDEPAERRRESTAMRASATAGPGQKLVQDGGVLAAAPWPVPVRPYGVAPGPGRRQVASGGVAGEGLDDQAVGDGEQHGAGEQEQAAVPQRQAQPHGAPRPPGAQCARRRLPAVMAVLRSGTRTWAPCR